MNKRLLLWMMVSFCLLSCGQKEPSSSELAPPPGAVELKAGEGGPGTEGWTTTNISEGMNLHTFKGNETVTKKNQNVYVLEVDLNMSRYRIGFSCQPGTDGRATTSQAQTTAGAVVAMNATYERGSVFIKVDGKTISNLPNNLISNEVPNWKSEAGAYLDAEGNFYLEFSGKGKTLDEQRAYYRSHTCPNIFTSSPMLIDNYELVGETFVPVELSEKQFEAAYHYEHPYRHQGVTHPRSAVALTADNHLLLAAIDEDRSSGSVKGMTAKEVTKFLWYHFNPQYALNMDGGGSTALSINGKVVNTPSGGEERAVPTHFLIFDDNK